MFELKKDLSVLTNIKEYNLDKLCKLIINIIGYDILESIKNKNTVTEINLGFGVLSVLIEEDILKYKFIPCTELETVIKNSYKGKNNLKLIVDKALGDRIIKSYKELF